MVASYLNRKNSTTKLTAGINSSCKCLLALQISEELNLIVTVQVPPGRLSGTREANYLSIIPHVYHTLTFAFFCAVHCRKKAEQIFYALNCNV